MTATAEDILHFNPPPLKWVEQALRFHEHYFHPTFFGFENVTADQPALYVANHTIYGWLDSPLLFLALYREKNIVLRSLGDSVHFRIPLWRQMLRNSGSVLGTRENCRRLMQAGEHILVFPGGGREVAKRKGEAHRLIWKTRTGFARMAMEQGYPIIPVAALGADDAYDILFDSLDLKSSRLGRMLLKNKTIQRELRDGDVFMPIARGIGPTPIPRPEKLYFSFGEPIETAPFQACCDDLEMQWQVRAKVMNALENQLERLHTIRSQDTDKGLIRKLLTRTH
jgi:1-acyl-sn-glycerol-3-phosphate acyltransferase